VSTELDGLNNGDAEGVDKKKDSKSAHSKSRENGSATQPPDSPARVFKPWSDDKNGNGKNGSHVPGAASRRKDIGFAGLASGKRRATRL
jgi:hypothetical protein